MAKIIPCGKPHPSEREALDYLRGELPDEFEIYHNFYIVSNRREYEVDALVVGPPGAFLVDFKGLHGQIVVTPRTWFVGTHSYHSPLRKIRAHARELAGDFRRECPGLFLNSCVVLTRADHPQPEVEDKDTLQHMQDICLLSEAASFFQRKGEGQSLTPAQYRAIEKFMKKRAKPQPHTFGDWLVIQELPVASDQYKEFLVQKKNEKDIKKKLRAYAFTETNYQKRSRNDYRLTDQLTHQNIVPISDAFEDEDEDFFLVVSANIDGKPLSAFRSDDQPDKNTLPELTLAVKCSIVREVLAALEHAHKNKILHRNITPGAVLIDSVDQCARLTDFGFGGFTDRTRTKTVRDLLKVIPDPQYAAPESYPELNFTTQSDLFSAGVVFFELFCGKRPFESRSALLTEDWELPMLEPVCYYDWLKRMCAKSPNDRFESARQALVAFNEYVSGHG